MVSIEPPTERECERCGRQDRWDEDEQNWVIRVVDGERLVGDRHCVHEWDINGRFSPVKESG